MEFHPILRERARQGPGIAPIVPGAVVGAYPGEFGNFGLDGSPADRGDPKPRLQDDGRASLPRAEDIEFVAADVNRPTLLGKSAAVGPERDELIGGSRGERKKAERGD